MTKHYDPAEWEGIFLPYEGGRPVMTVPPRMQATKKFVTEVADALDLDDERATVAADWIADKMERFGAAFAEPMFDTDGAGPVCSWCKAIWPLCGHHHLSGCLDDDDSRGGA